MFEYYFCYQISNLSILKIADSIKMQHKSSDKLKKMVSMNFQDDLGFRPISQYVVPSGEEMRKQIKQLKAQLEEERDKRLEVQKSLMTVQIRAIEREKQLNNVIFQSRSKLWNFHQVKESGKKGEGQQISKAYNELLKTFEKASNETYKIIEKKYKQNLQMMERRLATVQQTFNVQVAKSKRLSNENVEIIKYQIQKVLFLAKGIEEQNVNLRMEVKDEKHKCKLMDEERKLLIDEAVQKKSAFLKVLTQNKELKEELAKLKQKSQQKQNQKTQKYSKRSSRRMKSEMSEYLDENQGRILDSVLDNENDFESQTNHNYSSKRIPTKMLSSAISTSSIKIKDPNTFNKQKSALKTYQFNDILNQKQKKAQKQVNFSKIQRIQIPKKPKQNLFSSQINCENRESIQLQPNQKTIKHLQVCLLREKKKVQQYGKIITKIQQKNVLNTDQFVQTWRTTPSEKIRFNEPNTLRWLNIEINNKNSKQTKRKTQRQNYITQQLQKQNNVTPTPEQSVKNKIRRLIYNF